MVEPGAFEVTVGGASADVRLKGEIQARTPGQWQPGADDGVAAGLAGVTRGANQGSNR
jgi:hypothetical protein